MGKMDKTLSASDICWFSDPEAKEKSVVGGKGANLGILSQGGFAVPPGFTVTTAAYSRFIDGSKAHDKIVKLADGILYDDADSIEESTQAIRDLIVTAAMPTALEAKIRKNYEKLGRCLYVAVRSSGAAEDLAEASFAGLHDTYLDVQGADELLLAIKNCWASVWSARATSYRRTKGFDHFAAPIAVVVQQMVSSEVSGVLFTANPMNAATDEIVINASWGLGEAVVQGITTPDAFVLKHSDLRVIERTIGSKAVQIVRDPKTGRGTVTQDTPQAERVKCSLSDDELAVLGDVGRRVQKHYGDFPQDIEWGLAGGEFYVLQARPITSVEFSWEAEINASIPGKTTDDQIWSRNFADEGWTGAVTPLMFSWRAITMNMGHSYCMQTLGYPELDYPELRIWQYYQGKPYFNLTSDRKTIELTTPPALRRSMVLGKMPKSLRQEVLEAPFDYFRYAKMYLRLQTYAPENGLNWTSTLVRTVKKEATRYEGLSDEQLKRLSDEQLKTYINEMIELEGKGYNVVWTGLMIVFRDLLCLLELLLEKWYDGPIKTAFADLISGTRERSVTAIENLELWTLAQKIRESKTLRALCDQHEDGHAFFAELPNSEDGRAFLKQYDQFVKEHGHRGHADRDIYFIRRAEDPSVDYRPLKAVVGIDPPQSPEHMEHEVNERREKTLDAVVENIRRKPFGPIKAEIFKLLVDYVLKYIVGRDNERHLFDRSTFAIKKGYLELNRRALGKGVLESERDFYFLTKPELFDVFDGKANVPLSKAKIAARMRVFDRVESKEVSPPYYVQRGRPVDIDKVVVDGSGTLRGVGTSRGSVVGTARVVKTLKEIGRVQSGDILITNSTDPGWTPVFLMIKGIVLETGGILAHGSLLAREYGFPAVQIDDALQHIPDGARISVDGDAGVVTILLDDVPEAILEAA